ncbi:MAG: oxalurate catabolism protein HpxZ [Pseudomonadota bacterium]
MVINDPAVLAEVSSVFAQYEEALVTNDVATLDALFWDADEVVRYGGGETLYGKAEIDRFRRARAPVNLGRTVERCVITTFGQDFATASIHFSRDSAPGKQGRQMQTWARLPEGWRVVAAHVSVIATPAAV